MRILMVSDTYFPRVNGVSTSIRSFRRALQAMGHEVDLLAPDYDGRDTAEGVLRVPSWHLSPYPEDRLMRPLAALGMKPRLRERRYQLVHVHTPFAAHYLGVHLARCFHVPVLLSYHTYFEEYLQYYLPLVPRPLQRPFARTVSRWQCNGASGIVVPSQAMAELLRRYGVRAPLAVIPTGIDPVPFAAGDGARFRARHGIGSSQPVLIFIGRTAFEKNIAFLIEVVDILHHTQPDLLFLIAGEGPAKESLGRMAAERGLSEHVRLLGYLDREKELPDAYRAADIFVFASPSETQGLVLLEAMAAGTPVVSTAVLGTQDILAGGKGALVAEPEPHAFAAQCLRILRDPALKARLSAEGQAYCNRWSETEMARRLSAFYGLAVGTRAAVTPP